MRLVVDSSVWIDYFNNTDSPQVERLQRMLGVREIVVGDIVLTEVLQGFRSDLEYKRALELLGRFEIVPMLGRELAVASARNYRRLRKAGVTVRKTLDVMIGTYCLINNLPLLYSDRDFNPMVEHLGLIAVR